MISNISQTLEVEISKAPNLDYGAALIPYINTLINGFHLSNEVTRKLLSDEDFQFMIIYVIGELIDKLRFDEPCLYEFFKAIPKKIQLTEESFAYLLKCYSRNNNNITILEEKTKDYFALIGTPVGDISFINGPELNRFSDYFWKDHYISFHNRIFSYQKQVYEEGLLISHQIQSDIDSYINSSKQFTIPVSIIRYHEVLLTQIHQANFELAGQMNSFYTHKSGNYRLFFDKHFLPLFVSLSFPVKPPTFFNFDANINNPQNQNTDNTLNKENEVIYDTYKENDIIVVNCKIITALNAINGRFFANQQYFSISGFSQPWTEVKWCFCREHMIELCLNSYQMISLDFDDNFSMVSDFIRSLKPNLPKFQINSGHVDNDLEIEPFRNLCPKN